MLMLMLLLLLGLGIDERDNIANEWHALGLSHVSSEAGRMRAIMGNRAFGLPGCI
jgi:hypothetical protein